MNSYEKVGNSKMLGGFESNDIKRSDIKMVKSTWTVLNSILKELGKSYIELFTELKILVKNNIYKVLRSILIGVAAFAVFVGLTFGVLFIMGTYNRYIFSADNWKTYRSDRINMIDNMESKYKIVGMTRSEVEKVLGKPSYETPKEQCEYLALAKKDYDKVVEYTLNDNSRSIADVIAKNYVIAYKNDKAVYAEVLIADNIKN